MVTIEGVLTTDLGALESGRGGFIQDATGGIAVYLDAAASGWWPAGTSVVLRGSVSSRFSQRTLRVAESTIESGAIADLPVAQSVATGDVTEAHEGIRVSVSGTVDGAPDTLADGVGITLDDGSGPIRAVIGTDALAGQAIASGMTASVSGPLGQRDSSGNGAAGYRVHATLSGEVLVAEPTPSPTPTPSPRANPTPTPGTTPTPSTSSTPSTPETLAAARARAVGARVSVTAVVTVENGRLGTPGVIAVADDTGGIAVRLPSGVSGFPRGTLLEISGTLAAPYGQLEIRASTDGLRAVGSSIVPAALPLGSGPLDETVEGRLVTVTGTLAAKPKRSSSGDLTLILERSGAASIKVMADSSSQLVRDAFTVGATYRIVGVVGQRATKKDANDGHRVCVRDLADAVALAGAGVSVAGVGTAGSAGAAPLPGSPGASVTPALPIAKALGLIDRLVAIEGIVTAPAALLDATGRRIVVQDSSAAIELLLPSGSDAPAVGTRVRAVGRVGLAYGAPRLRSEEITILGAGRSPATLTLRGAPTVAQEWRLASVTGRIDNVRKLGDRWRAELLVAGARVVVAGQPGSRIPVDAMVEGRMASITGIVRRPYPTASDQRFAITPRTPADLRVHGASASGGGRGTNSSGAGAGSPDDPGPANPRPGSAPVDADLVDLGSVTGRTVRVGGLVVDLRPDGLLLDDGTTVGLIVLRGPALELLPLIEPDDAINAIGHVEQVADGLAVVVDEPGGIIQAGDPVASAFSGAHGVTSTMPVESTDGRPASGVPLAQQAGFLEGPGGIGAGVAGLAGLGTLIALSMASLAITLGRRARSRRRLEARVAARVAALEASAGRPPGSRSAERGDGPFHAA